MAYESEVCPVTQLKLHKGSNIIAEPGKFEGSPRYLPEFYEVMLEGFADEHSDGSFSVAVDADDKLKYPELKRRKRIRMYQDEQGFVSEL